MPVRAHMLDKSRGRRSSLLSDYSLHLFFYIRFCKAEHEGVALSAAPQWRTSLLVQYGQNRHSKSDNDHIQRTSLTVPNRHTLDEAEEKYSVVASLQSLPHTTTE